MCLELTAGAFDVTAALVACCNEQLSVNRAPSRSSMGAADDRDTSRGQAELGRCGAGVGFCD